MPIQPPTDASPEARSIDLDATPVEVAARLRGLPGFFFLDTSTSEGTHGGRPLSLVGALPNLLLRGHIAHDTDILRAALAQLGQSGADCGLPLGGLFGSVDFDGAFAFGRYPQLLAFDHASGRWTAVGRPGDPAFTRLVTAARSARPRHSSDPTPRLDFAPELERERFLAMVRRAQEYIAAGDIYQVNLSQRFAATLPAGGDPFAFYLRLRDVSPAPYAAFLDLGGRQLLSASPECFLDLSGPRVRTRPIKGTRPRHRDPGDDERAACELVTSPKERAELVMITDLERNDLGRVCEFGSVRVTELLKLEIFAQVFHLVSTVEGRLRPDLDHAAALAACFPGGSISGAPKKRALEIIAELEPVPRGLYTGAIGYLGGGGESAFSIAIRTAVAEAGQLSLHTGAGIVADSDPAAEYEETLHKAAGFFAAASRG